jgi:hypothetical protein
MKNMFKTPLNLGPVTVYAFNRKHIWIDVKAKRFGYITFERTPRRKSWCMYASPNATPWACTWYAGTDKEEAVRGSIRKYIFGHGFDCRDESNYAALCNLNDSLDDVCFETMKTHPKEAFKNVEKAFVKTIRQTEPA